MKLPIDQQSRTQALDPAVSCIVQAPAGSGKTGLLIRRFLILLAHVSVPEEILAITFTRKATAEMRHRVVSALKMQKEDGSAEDNQELLKLAGAALQNDQKHQWNIVQNVNRLRIQTIDSFCSELVNRMPWSARFGSPPSIVEDARPLLRRAALRTLSRVEDTGDPRFANDCGNLITLMDARLDGAVEHLADMLARRDQWMRFPIQHSREQIEHWWQQTIDETLRSANDLFPADIKRSLAELAVFSAENLHQTYADSDTVSPIQGCLGMSDFPAASHEHLDQWRGITAMLITAKADKFRSTVTVRDGFPPNKKDEKQRIKQILDMLADDHGALQLLARIPALPDAHLQEEEWQNIESLLNILPVAAAELRVLFNELNQADYIELAQRAEYALGNDEHPTDLALVFDHRIQHMMVDEFQDTSAGQLSLLRKLLAGWGPDDGRSAFFVGDPMQSIYRFREAEIANFLDVQSSGIADIRPTPLLLQTNFRSDSAIVNWCNHAFAQIMPRHDDKVLGAVRYAPATAFWKASECGAVQIHPSVDADEVDEAEAILSLIKKEINRSDDATIAILGKTRRHLSAIATRLSDASIPFDAVNLQMLGERQVIQDINALTCALLQPQDRSAWLGVLRAPWCGLTLSSLTQLLAGKEHLPVSEVVGKVDAKHGLNKSERIRVMRVVEVMSRSQSSVGRLPLWNVVESTWLQLGGPAICDAADLDNCHRYLALLKQLESDGTYISSTTLETALEKLWAAGSVHARVKLMTIHGAKGLEFDTIILPGLHRPSRGSHADLIRFRPLSEKLLIAAKPASVHSEDAAYRFLGQLEKESLKNESARLLYVACTRARQQLHLFGTLKTNTRGDPSPPVSNSLLALLWPIMSDQFTGNDQLVSKSKEHPEAEVVNDPEYDPHPLERLPDRWQPPPLSQSISYSESPENSADEKELIEFDWAGEIARVCGIVVHQLYQQIDLVGWRTWQQQVFDEVEKDHCSTRLLENGLPVTLLPQATELVERALINTREDQNADWIFSPAHQHIRSEWPVTGFINNTVQHIVIDRSFVAPDESGKTFRWIIDFKTSRHDETENLEEFVEQERIRYRNTMNKYARIVRALGEEPVKTALYFPVLKRLELLD
ncbi:MAG: UvrD-helicase domain-containing protein [Granulosicoccus sp.]|nr:UvrD-helicase domain-containing protein [Granulosicoccus sp.]